MSSVILSIIIGVAILLLQSKPKKRDGEGNLHTKMPNFNEDLLDLFNIKDQKEENFAYRHNRDSIEYEPIIDTVPVPEETPKVVYESIKEEVVEESKLESELSDNEEITDYIEKSEILYVIDKRNLILYSEIMKPKFSEID